MSIVVLMPVFNCTEDAWRTIASFDEPTLSPNDWRILVVDDGSRIPFDPQRPPPDVGCPAGVQIEVLRLASNGGIEAALAAGVDALLGLGDVRYIARIDAGDLALPSRLAKQRQFLDTHPEVGAVGMWARAVTRSGATAFMLTPPSAPNAIRRMRFARSCFIHPAMMLRAETVRLAGNYCATYPAAEDLDLFLRMMQHADCANLPEVGLLYEINETGISATRRRHQIVSTLRLQAKYFNVGNPYDWLGLAKNALHLVMPYRHLHIVKRRLFKAIPK